MKRTRLAVGLIVVAAAAGFGTSALLVRTRFGRGLLEQFFQPTATVRVERNLQLAAAHEVIPGAEIDHQVELFRDQFGDDQHFNDALRSAKLSLGELRDEVTTHLRERAWIERQIAPQLQVSDGDIRNYFAAHRAQFTQPERYRVNHLFLAAPDGSPSEVILSKLSAIEGLSVRLLADEKLPTLIAELSEDEARRTRAGNLNFFSALRMTPEFIDELKKLEINQISGPVRSHLGFHLVQLAETKPSREMGFDEARPEIALALANQRRALAVAALREQLSTPEFNPH